REAIEKAERLADSAAGWDHARLAWWERLCFNVLTYAGDGWWVGVAGLLREIVGNPFHPVTLNPAWLTWNDGTVPKVAQAIYDDRAFDRMPILADALEDAGCTDQAILDHCRGPGEHVRGCWVVDLLLGKE